MNKYFKLISRYRYFLISLTIIVLFNIVAVSLFRGVRVDMTETSAYSLSPISKEIVSDIKDPLRIKVFFSKNLPAPYDQIESYLREILGQYKNYSTGNFTYEFFDVTIGKKDDTVDENIALATKYGISPVSVQEVREGAVKMVKVYLGMVIEYGSIKERIPVFKGIDKLEFKITRILNKVISYQKKMQNLDKNIEVALYLPDNFKKLSKKFGIVGLDGVDKTVSNAVDENNKKSFNKLIFKNYSQPINNNLKLTWFNSLDVKKIKWESQSVDGEVLPKGEGYAVVVIQNNEQTSVLNLMVPTITLVPGQGLRSVYKLRDMSNFEEDIYVMVNEVLKLNKRVAYLKDKGTKKLLSARNPYMMNMQQGGDDSISNFNQEVREIYTLSTVNLDEIPSMSEKTLIIAGINEVLTDKDIFIIDQFVMKGGNLIVFYDNLQLDKTSSRGRSLNFVANSSGFSKLINSYGMGFEDGYVLDDQAFEAFVPNQFGDREQKIIRYVPHLMGDQINQDYEPLKYIKNLYMVQLSPINLISEVTKDNKDILFKELFTSSDNAWISKNVEEKFPPSSKTKSRKVLGYLAVGKFQSYFKDKDLLNEELKSNFISSSKKKSKIVIIGSSEILSNSLFDLEQGQLVTAIMGIIDDVSGNGQWTPLRNKVDIYSSIEPYDEEASFLKAMLTSRTNLKIFNIGFIAFGVLIFALVMFLKRKRYKRSIDNL